MIDVLVEAMRICRERRTAARLAAAKHACARQFNHLYTYTSRQGRWMCPLCNRIHDALGWEPFCGLRYPECCTFPEGHRQHYHLHATTSNGGRDDPLL